MTENDLRDCVRVNWKGWLDWSEPHAVAAGRPDVDLLIGGRIVPVELKLGKVVEVDGLGAWIEPDKIRPSQVSWERRFRDAGGVSLWLFADEREEGKIELTLAWTLRAHRLVYKQFFFAMVERFNTDELQEKLVSLANSIKRL